MGSSADAVTCSIYFLLFSLFSCLKGQNIYVSEYFKFQNIIRVYFKFQMFKASAFVKFKYLLFNNVESEERS